MAFLYFFMVLVSLIVLGTQAADPGATPFWMVSLLIGSGTACLFALAIELRRPVSEVDDAGDAVRGVYFPRSTPITGAESLVGRLVVWTAVYKHDKGEFKGEWAMSAVIEDGSSVWVPLSDLVVQKRRRGFLFQSI